MSASEEDTELKELVIQALENNGVLAKIRAQLRASVFLALDEANSLQKNKPLVNKELQDYLSTKNGKYVAYLVHNFLSHFKLDSSLSVFEPESYYGQIYGTDEHGTIGDYLKIGLEDGRVPLLDKLVEKCTCQTLERNTNESRVITTSSSAPPPHPKESHLLDTSNERVPSIVPDKPTDKNTERSIGEGEESRSETNANPNNNDNGDDEDDDDFFFDDPPLIDDSKDRSPPRRPHDASPTSSNFAAETAATTSTKKSDWDSSAPSPVRPTDYGGQSLKPLTDSNGGSGGGLSKLESSFSGSILGSLRGVPPLTEIKAKLPPLNLWKDDPSPSQKTNSKNDAPVTVDDYEEDFLSSASIRSDQKTGTELSIEEDIEEENQSLHVDDLLSNEANSEVL